MRPEKKIRRRIGRAIVAFLLAAVMALEPAAGSMTAYAVEPVGSQSDLTTGKEGALSQENKTEEEEGEEESDQEETPGDGEEDTDEGTSEDGDRDTEEGGEENPGDGSEENGGDDSDEENTGKEEGDNSGEEDVEEGEEADSEEDIEDGDLEDAEDIDEEDAEAGIPSEEEDMLPEKNASKLTAKELQAMERKLDEWAERTGRIPSGYIDVDFEVERLAEPVGASDDSFPAAKASVSIPARYDARAAGLVSNVKNQGSWGTCWAFSAVTSAESAYKRLYGTEPDLSETHLVNFFYNGNAGADLAGPDGGLSGDKTTCLDSSPVNRGGNSLFTTFAMANWTGIADENGGNDSLRYPSPAETRDSDTLYIDSDLAYEDAMHLENAYWINISERDSVKEAIMEYGVVGVSYYYEWCYDSDAYKEYINSSYDGMAVYYNPVEKRTNHAVAIVGWDDTFSRDNFKYTYNNACAEEYGYGSVKLPAKDGAWLIKNSWGKNIGDAGYFWISYEDVSLLAAGNAYAFDFGAGDNYDHNYQYDGSNGIRTYSASQVTAAAVYTVNGADNTFQEISAVGVGFAVASSDYTVKIYTDLEDPNNPESGVLAAEKSGKTSFQGFYTIKIDDTVIVEAGETFGIVVTAKKSGKAALFVDTSYTNGSWVRFDASTGNDRTFYKSGNTWYDAGKKKNFTFRIKAYTNDSAAPVISATDKFLNTSMLEEIMPQEYTGNPVEPEPALIFSGERLTKDADYTVSYNNNIEVSSENQKAQMIITGIGEYAGSDFSAEFSIVPKIISEDMISIDNCIYDGTVRDNLLTLTYNENLMVKDKDYAVKYSKTPQNAGSYSVTVTGKGNYTGTVKQSFVIEKLNLDNSDASISMSENEEYTGSAIKPVIQVMYNGKVIPAANYTIKYQNNKSVGTAMITVTGKANCTKGATKEFHISPRSLAADKVTVSVKEGIYTGEAVTPNVTVKDGKVTLKKNRDYTLTYEDNIDASTEAKVTVNGIGNYAGERLHTFTVKPRAVASNKIAVALNAPYGEGILACSVNVNGKKVDSKEYNIVIKKTGTEEEIDEDNLVLGERYDITVILTNNYQGRTTLKKAICTRAVGSLNINLDNGDSYEYTGSAMKPSLTVEDESGKLLRKGTDYNIAYTNNINAGNASVLITGKGKYGGTVSIPFVIRPKTVMQEELKVSIPAQNYTGNELKPAVTIKYGRKTLKNGTDYRLGDYSNNKNVSYNEQQETISGAGIEITLLNYRIRQNAEDSAGTDTLTGNFMIRPVKISKVTIGPCYYQGGSKVEPNVTVKAGKFELTPEDYDISFINNEEVGKKASVTVTASKNSNYTGSRTVSFKIAKEPFSKAAVEGISERIYTGAAIEIPAAEIKVKNSNGAEVLSDAYTVKYKNNIKVGTASLIITAKPDSIYSGSKTIKFKINKADLKDVIGDACLDAKTYTGKKLTYTTNEIKNAVAAATGGKPTYKVSYSNNVDAGTAKVILTGTGSYTGTKEIAFTILPCSLKNVAVRLKSNKLSYNNGNPVYAQINKVVHGKLVLRQGKDYTVSYVNSKGLGAAYIRITGRGNYSGMKSVYYSISE